MKKLLLLTILVTLCQLSVLSQTGQIKGKEVFKNDDVVFHEIDEHTWVGTGEMMSNESLYIVEGADKAVLIDAGTNITGLDKIVAAITKKTSNGSSHTCSSRSYRAVDQLFFRNIY